MVERTHIERVLKINGVSTTAGDDEIRVILLGARYSEAEVATAITVLRSSPGTVRATESDSLHKLMRTDKNLNASEISKLLGIDIVLPGARALSNKAVERTLSVGHHIVIWSLAIVIGILGIGLSMYALEFGIFHPASALTMYGYR